MKFAEMKCLYRGLGFLCVLCASVLNCFSLDREAFTFTNYDLNVQVEPQQHRLGVRGKLTLRNDSQSSQKIAVLQISSSLDWRSIKSGDKPLQFLSQPYTSDIDHTGSLSEAIVTLPQAVAPKATIELEIAYEGVILLDATRLTRIGTPEETANNTDWDQIGPTFSAVRGAGYVAWYPIATEVANLSEGNSLFKVLDRWRAREAGWKMRLHVDLREPNESTAPTIMLNRYRCTVTYQAAEGVQYALAGCDYQASRLEDPILMIGNYHEMLRPKIDARFLVIRGHEASAAAYADEAERGLPLIADWFGAPREEMTIADLADSRDAPFESSTLLMTPLGGSNPSQAGLAAVHQLTHASFLSVRSWIQEGLAHFAQALYVEREKGRPAALEYMGAHQSAWIESEHAEAVPRPEDEISRSLTNTTNEELYRSKAMCVWWMLRDMVGESALKKAIAAYRPEQDKEPSYMPRLIAAQTQRDLGWFFDDWVYGDRGLPDFKIESAFSRKTVTGSFMLTITLDNLGTAGAEVPIIVQFKGGEIMKRLEVRAKNKAVIRVEVPAAPQEIVVNDGSVPESDITNNVFKIPQEAK
jgi:hypothetical protein